MWSLEKSDKSVTLQKKKKLNFFLALKYCYFFLCRDGRFNGYVISINGYITVIEQTNTGAEFMASPGDI